MDGSFLHKLSITCVVSVLAVRLMIRLRCSRSHINPWSLSCRLCQIVETCCGIISIGGIVAEISPAMISLATAVIGITHIRSLRLIKLATEEK
jgi:hypothetical protein